MQSFKEVSREVLKVVVSKSIKLERNVLNYLEPAWILLFITFSFHFVDR
jgi:hypothetical protein